MWRLTIKRLTAVAVLAGMLTGLTPAALTHAATAGSVDAWQTGTALPTAGFSNSTAATYNGYAYVLGGASSGNPLDTVYYASLSSSDGSVGSWSSATSLPVPLVGSTAVEYGGHIFVFGGETTGLTAVNTVYSAPINSDGTLGSWSTQTHLPIALSYGGSTIVNGYVYIVGGFDGSNSNLDTVYYAKLNTDGTLGSSWTLSPNTTSLTSYSSVISYNGYIYKLGGNYGNGANYAHVNSDGSTGAWSALPDLPMDIEATSGTVANGYVYLVGGQGNSTPVYDTVFYAPINSDGTLGTWQTSPSTMPVPKSNASGITYNNYLYVFGGDNTSDVNTVYYAHINPPATPTPSSNSTNTTTVSTNPSAAVTAPATGYGAPSNKTQSIFLIAGALVTLAAGLIIRRAGTERQ